MREKGVAVIEPLLPCATHIRQNRTRLLHTLFQQLGRRHIVGVIHRTQGQIAFGEKGVQRVAQVELVAQREFDVQALDAVGVLAHAWQGNHNVFVDLEGVGVAADGRCAFAIEPKFLARFGADGHKTFATAGVGQTHDFRGSTRHIVCVVASDVAHQHHLRKTATLTFCSVTNRLEVAVV